MSGTGVSGEVAEGKHKVGERIPRTPSFFCELGFELKGRKDARMGCHYEAKDSAG
jgi:hypothetical protein